AVATVSRTLAMPDLVAPDTRRRVHDTIRRMGYTPNAQARNLRTARTNVIVALVPDISNPFFAEVIRGIEQVAHRSHYSVLLGDTQYNRAREQGYADLLNTRQADGLITLLPHIPKIIAAGRLPIVNACEYVRDRSITSVYVDNVAAAQQATEYLLTLGHRVAVRPRRELPRRVLLQRGNGRGRSASHQITWAARAAGRIGRRLRRHS